MVSEHNFHLYSEKMCSDTIMLHRGYAGGRHMAPLRHSPGWLLPCDHDLKVLAGNDQ